MLTITKEIDVDVCTMVEVDIELGDVLDFIRVADNGDLRYISEEVSKAEPVEEGEYLVDDYWDEYIHEVKDMYSFEEFQQLVPLKW